MVRRRLRRASSPFYFARFKAGFVCPKACAELLGITIRTVHNWDRKGSPVHVLRFLHLLNGDLGELFKTWKGFRLTAEALIGPGRLRVPVEEIRNHPQTVERLALALAQLDRIHRWPIFRFLLRWYPGSKPNTRVI